MINPLIISATRIISRQTMFTVIIFNYHVDVYKDASLWQIQASGCSLPPTFASLPLSHSLSHAVS